MGTGTNEAGALVRVQAEATQFVAGDSDGQAIAFAHFSYFDGAIAYGGNLVRIAGADSAGDSIHDH